MNKYIHENMCKFFSLLAVSLDKSTGLSAFKSPVP